MSTLAAAVAFALAASMPSEPLAVGESHTVPLTFTVNAGWAVDQAGMPGAILQIDLPENVELEGKILSDEETKKKQFLRMPFERMLEEGANEVTFKLTGERAADAALHFNVLGYASRGEKVEFVRQRYALPLTPGAKLREIDASPSDWGQDTSLQLGDKLPKLELPQADGTMIDLGEHLGKSNIVITTYRAFW